MIRGTTPTFTLTLTGVELEYAQSVHVTLRNGMFSLDLTGEDLDIDTEHGTIGVYLTQERSLQLTVGTPLEIQVNGLDSAGHRWASGIGTVVVDNQLLNEVIE